MEDPRSPKAHAENGGSKTHAGGFDSDRLDRRDGELIELLLPWVQTVSSSYLGLRKDGLEHLPREPALFVANHNGGIFGPDLICTLGTLWEHLGPRAPLYGLAHDFAMRQFRPLGALLQRFGAVRACPENAMRILASGGQALVYPGGDLEAYRHSALRDRIVLGERTGFVRIAQRANVPIVPIVSHGAHRSAWIFHDGANLARWLRLHRWARLERFPLALALPWGFAAGPWIPYLPLPFRVRMRMLPPVRAGMQDDPASIRELVRARMQAALDDLAVDAR